jgi:hypothetical protein
VTSRRILTVYSDSLTLKVTCPVGYGCISRVKKFGLGHIREHAEGAWTKTPYKYDTPLNGMVKGGTEFMAHGISELEAIEYDSTQGGNGVHGAWE